MSMAIERAKYTGDPGWLGDVFGGIAKVGLGLASNIPIFGGAAKIASGYLFPPAPGTTTYAQQPYIAPIPNRPTAGPGGVSAMDCAGNWSDVAARYGMTVGQAQLSCAAAPKAPGIGAVFQRALPGGATGLLPFPDLMTNTMNGAAGMAAMQAGKPCPVSGYHWNKSGYFLKSGQYVQAGTKMVKNRRRNPANPRATSNAITRITGAKRYAASLGRISIRKKC